MWFEDLTGFAETSAEDVRANLDVTGTTMVSRVNGRAMEFGRLETPSLDEMRLRVAESPWPEGHLVVDEVIGDARRLHTDQRNAGALFQAASQFNLLEMLSPSYTPENGIGIYQNDPTQGPACAIAAGAGTIFRNYFVEFDEQVGQTSDHQIDCLRDVGNLLGNVDGRLWRMCNGYALATGNGLIEITDRIAAMTESERDEVRRALRVGVQWDTQVTLRGCRHLVSQAYCSALPVAYSEHPAESWADFAELILEAAYEATLSAAVLNTANTGNNRVFLTALGGGAFGNEPAWIHAALQRAIDLFADFPLHLSVVAHGRSSPWVRELRVPR